MIRNYLKIIRRRLYKDKLSTSLNLIGLSTGLACSLFIYLWITDELAVDKFHEKDNQLYQIMENQANGNVIKTVEWTPAPLATSLLTERSEVQEAVTVMPSNMFPESALSISGAAKLKGKPQFASKAFFNIFSYKLISGDRSEVLSQKNDIVISEDLAYRLFHTSQNIIGKTIDWQLLQWKGQSIVSGVFETVPSNSTQQFDFVLPFEAFIDLLPRFKDNWQSNSPSTYVVLKKNTDVAGFNAMISDFVKSKKTKIPMSRYSPENILTSTCMASTRMEYNQAAE
jgi:putative ABC transport system permease protein